MFGFYTPILVLQGICVIHAYRNNAEQRWYWLILLLPLLGSILYLVHHFGNRSSLETITEGVKGVVNSSHRIEQLEKEVKHADSVTNKLNLADEYVSVGRTEQAIALYEQCATGFMEDDPALRMKLLHAYFLKGDYLTVIRYGDMLRTEKSFKDAEERVALAWAYYHTGDQSTANAIFESMDRPFTNYTHRLEYCKFLNKSNQPEALRSRLAVILDEFETMKGQERRTYRPLLGEFQLLKNALAA